MKKFYLLLILFVFGVWEAQAQVVPAKAKMLFQRVLDSMQLALPVKGINAAIRLPNGAVWEGASGISTENPTLQVMPGDVYATGSSTKTMTAMCVLQLVDEGLIALEDSLGLYLPDINNVNPQVTVKQLLQHTSGIRDIFQHPSFQPTLLQNKGRIWKLEDVVRYFTGSPEFSPGTRWKYSNTNYLLLGMLIEAVSGKNYHENFKERFLQPLGLDSYRNFAFDAVPPNTAHLWLDITGDGVLDDAHTWFTTWKSLFSATGPAGGYFADATDLAKWMEVAMTGSLISADTWAEANSNLISQGGGVRYGLGFSERYFLGERSLGHGGDISYSTSAYYFPDRDISISVLTNDASVISWEQTPVVNALLQAIIKCGDALTGTSQVERLLDTWAVFPNPIKDFCYLKNIGAVKGKTMVSLFDESGKMIAADSFSVIHSDQTIPLFPKTSWTHLKGTILLKIANEEGSSVIIPLVAL